VAVTDTMEAISTNGDIFVQKAPAATIEVQKWRHG
jgi:hypothetical protein